MNSSVFRGLAAVAFFLALFVVVLGAYTRLSAAGLGCPDWPGCYGHLVLPQQEEALANAQAAYPDKPIESQKAWTEMAHRYAAGSLGLLIAVIAVVALFKRSHPDEPVWVPVLLLALVVFQAALGMWTVTLKLLPIVVMGHLLGGMSIVAALAWLNIRLRHARLPRWHGSDLQWLAVCAATIVFLQMALGGWVSSNYAGLACTGFPMCNGQWLPALDLSHAFQLFSHVGPDYQGGLLDITSRITIQFVHRLGAFVTFGIIAMLSYRLWRDPRPRVRGYGLWLFVIVCVQFSLGVLNVMWMLPLPIAVLHNAFAAILFATVVGANFYVALPLHEEILS